MYSNHVSLRSCMRVGDGLTAGGLNVAWEMATFNFSSWRSRAASITLLVLSFMCSSVKTVNRGMSKVFILILCELVMFFLSFLNFFPFFLGFEIRECWISGAWCLSRGISNVCRRVYRTKGLSRGLSKVCQRSVEGSIEGLSKVCLSKVYRLLIGLSGKS